MQKNDLVSIIIPFINIKKSLPVEKVLATNKKLLNGGHVHLKQTIAIHKTDGKIFWKNYSN